jgi:hypothetical protein
VSDQLELIEETLVYVDSPLEGHLRSKTGDLYTFRCVPVVRERLWHWILLPASSNQSAVADVFQRAQHVTPTHWISLVEDRRGDQPRVHAAWLSGDTYKLINQTGDSRERQLSVVRSGATLP